MEFTSMNIRGSSHYFQNNNRTAASSVSKMSLLTMTAPSPPHVSSSFRGSFSWDADLLRPTPEIASFSSSRSSRMEHSESFALPSIRQAIPELQLQIMDRQLASSSNTSSPAAGPALLASSSTSTSALRGLPALSCSSSTSTPVRSVASPSTAMSTSAPTLPEYIHSPSSSYKRQRLSADDRDERFNQVPRLCTQQSEHQQSQYRKGAITSGGNSPTLNTSATSSPPTSSASSATGHTLPSLPHLRLEYESRGYASDSHTENDAYGYHQYRNIQQNSSSSYSAYSHHHPTRMQSLSLGSIRSFDRASFPPSSTNGGYHPLQRHHHQSTPPLPPPPSSHHSGSAPASYGRDFMPVGEFGSLGLTGHVRHLGSGGGLVGGSTNSMGSGNGCMAMPGGADTKQRKRRGNLPKETTDKLRTWFMGHLHHPYPSEDEKQELMRQTGLQMNQISNWFINARRRQLPAMINNARVESDAMSTRGTLSGNSNNSNSSVAGISHPSQPPHSQSLPHQFHHHHHHHHYSNSNGSNGPVGGHHSQVLPTTERILPSPEQTLVQRPLVGYSNGNRAGSNHSAVRTNIKHGSPLSEDDYEDMSPHTNM